MGANASVLDESFLDEVPYGVRSVQQSGPLSGTPPKKVLPVREKHVHNGSYPESGLVWGVGEMQGWRPAMEDAHVAIGSLSEGQGSWSDTGLFAVFDGHGGPEAAKFCAERFPRAVAQGRTSKAAAALHDSFLSMDKMLADVGDKMEPTARGHPDRVGSTAVACAIQPDSITVANAGDSRAVLSRSGRAVDLSQDHKPNLDGETARITKAGGYVSTHHLGPHTMHRVNGELAVSRAIGDLHYKKAKHAGAGDQIVTCVPDTQTCKRQPEDEFMVLACDGIWDVLTSQEVVDRVQVHLPAIHSGLMKPADAICRILDECLASDPAKACGRGMDNMTMILIVFEDSAFEVPQAQMRRGLSGVVAGCINSRATPGQPKKHEKLEGPNVVMRKQKGRPVLLGATKNYDFSAGGKRPSNFTRTNSVGST